MRIFAECPNLLRQIPLIERPNLSATLPAGGYGYQFWTCTDQIANRLIDIVEAKGNGGQAIFFCKSLNLLVVTTGGNYNKGLIRNNPHVALTQYIIPSILFSASK